MNEAAPVLSRFDVATLHPSRRRQAWAEAQHDYFYAVDLSAAPDFARGWVQSVDIAGVRLARYHSDPVAVRRTAPLIARKPEDFYFLPVLLDEGLAFRQRGRQADLARGRFAFVSSLDAYDYDQPKRATFHSLRFSGPAVRERTPHVDDWTAHDFGDHVMVRLFLDFANSFCSHGITIDPAIGHRITAHLLDLLALVISGADQHCDETAVRLAHRQRALQVIEIRFRDPDFSASDIGIALKLSERYLQKIFAEHGETPSGAIRSRRLTEARRLLQTRNLSRASISAIAYAVGFSEPAYFSRAFRAAVGTSPLDYARRG
ncbi:AraC family transcriptional regulator [Ancylobacter sonchi]|uniref:helix-turn-helix transcriptional regulator n=1 Tax=Ancylobacter sonchi TaxID=1937790 RepID=UPI001BD4E323|nr:helix-turn-helix domain-containing protein [Ancylobacter sonchi]MBS7535320.1 AraC family transcriptional regulator [Ancylobacter sonchi]